MDNTIIINEVVNVILKIYGDILIICLLVLGFIFYVIVYGILVFIDEKFLGDI